MATVAEIVTLARQRADMENNNFISPTEAIAYVSSSYKELYDILVARFEDYYLTSASLTVSSGNSTSLPADFYKLRGVDYYDGGRYHALKPFQFGERHYMEDDDVSGTYRIWYVPVATSVTLDADTIPGINGWEEYVVIDAAIKMLLKEESDVSALMATKQEMKGRIVQMAQNRDVSKPDTIEDIYVQEFQSVRDIRYRLLGSSIYFHLHKDQRRYY